MRMAWSYVKLKTKIVLLVIVVFSVSVVHYRSHAPAFLANFNLGRILKFERYNPVYVVAGGNNPQSF